MNTATHSPSPDDPTTMACRDVLMDIMQVGAELIQCVREEAGPVADRVATYERAARAVRRTVRMIKWLNEPTPIRRAAVDRAAARQRVLRAVEDRIDAAAKPDEADSLHFEALERLDSLEFEADIGRPVIEVIGEICRDLGLGLDGDKHAPLRRRLVDVAALYARAAAPPGGMRDVLAPDLPLTRQRPPPGEIDWSKLTDEELDAMDPNPPDPSWRTEHQIRRRPPDG